MRNDPPGDCVRNGACGLAAAVGSMNGTPPSGSATVATQAAASDTISSSSLESAWSISSA